MQLTARIRQGTGETATERFVGESAYELNPGQRTAVPVVIPRWARRILARAPQRIRFSAEGPELARHRVKLSIAR